MKKKYLALATLLAVSSYAAFGQVTFNYTGSAQTYTVPSGITQISVVVKGAEGNGNANNNLSGGLGGEVTGTMTVTPCEILQINVGGGGVNNTVNGGWNGGGAGGVGGCSQATGAGGGGASDIRVPPYALTNRMVVGGGGGGTAGDRMYCCGPGAGGGGGGGYYGGGGGGGYSGHPGTGGSQAAGGIGGAAGVGCPGPLSAGANGALGLGGAGGIAPANCQFGPQAGCTGGAGGTLTGATGVTCGGMDCLGSGQWMGGAGGGGSNYADPSMSSVVQTQGIQTGNGIIVITPIGSSTPLVIATTETNPTCGGGCNGSITAHVTGGSTPYTYLWTPGNQSTQTITGLCAGSYTVTVTDLCGDITTAAVTLTGTSILVTPTVTANELCNGNCNGIITTSLVGGSAPYTYVWTPSGGSNSAASNLCAGSYTVTVNDVNGCTGTATATITQPTALAATASSVNILCNGGTSTLTATATGGTGNYGYVWTPGGNTNAIASGISAGTYTMTVTDANGCTASASTTITQPTVLAVNVTGPTQICIGASGTLTANVTGGTTPYGYAWSSGITSVTSTASITPLISQNYTVTVTDANGCTTSGQVTVNLGPPLVLSVSGTSSICNGRSATLCASVTGGTGGDVYLWLPGNQTTPCITVSPNSTSTYTLSVSDNCGTTATITTTVRINPSPAVDFSADLYQGCAPLCVQFRNTTTISQGGLTQYVWTFGNGDTLQSQSPIYCYANAGTYNVGLTVVSDSGCSSTLSKANMITAYSHPSAGFTVSPQNADILAPTIQFTDKSKDINNVLYWSWSFGDASDSISKLQNPSHTYQDTGRYCANLVVMDSHGCTDTATNCLVINPVFTLYIPSGFSPNGDGKNDVFQPVGKFIKSFEMYIFDRWGMQVYHTTDITKGWNGSVKGGSSIAQEDSYEYKISVTDSQNKEHSYTGQINLIK